MTTPRLVEDVREIDRELRRYPWLDMSIVADDGSDLVVWGCLSESYPFEVRLVFRDAQCILARRSWHTDTSKTVFREVMDPDFNQRYRIEFGQRTFELFAEDLAVTMRISAASVFLEIHNEPR